MVVAISVAVVIRVFALISVLYSLDNSVEPDRLEVTTALWACQWNSISSNGSVGVTAGMVMLELNDIALRSSSISVKRNCRKVVMGQLIIILWADKFAVLEKETGKRQSYQISL